VVKQRKPGTLSFFISIFPSCPLPLPLPLPLPPLHHSTNPLFLLTLFPRSFSD
jgi:hypothetical protein